MKTSLWCVAWYVMVAGTFGCGKTSGSRLDWRIKFSSEELRSRAARIDAKIRKSSCEGEVVYATSIVPDQPPSTSDSILSNGQYAIEAKAYDTQCTMYADACIVVNIPAGAVPIVLELNQTGEARACALEQCLDGMCQMSQPQDQVTDTTPWWNTAYQQRIRLTVNTLDILESLSDFPIRVALSSRVKDLQSRQGADVRFVTPEGDVLAHELEQSDIDTVQMINAWVNLPKLDSSQNVLYVYFSNADAAFEERPEVVWPSSRYTGVFHLNQTPKDSSQRQWHGTVPEEPMVTEPGKIGLGLNDEPYSAAANRWVRLDGNGDRGYCAGSEYCTVSAWVKVQTLSTFPTIAWVSAPGTDAGGNGGWHLLLGLSFTAESGSPLPQGYFQFRGSTMPYAGVRSTFETRSGLNTLGSWKYLVYTVDHPAHTALLYVDGELAASTTIYAAGAEKKFEAAPNNWVRIGGYLDNDIKGVDATIDEVRFERVTPSAAWVKAQYLSMQDLLISYGAMQKR